MTVVPGQIVTSGDWDALFTQHGGMPQTTPAVRRARTPAEIASAGMAGDDDPGAQQRPIYRYVLADGSYVDARTSQDGAGWEIIEYKPSQQYQQTQQRQAPQNQRTPEQQRAEAASAQRAEEQARNEAALNAERDWHAQQGHGRYTHAEWDQELRRREAEARAQGNQEAANQLARERFQFERERASQPDVKTEAVDVDGVKYTRVTTIPRDGRPVTVQHYGPDGKPIAALPQPGASVAPPSDIPPFRPDPNRPGYGLDEWIATYVTPKWRDGKLSAEQVKLLVGQAHTAAKAEEGRISQIATLQQNQQNADLTQRAQDIGRMGTLGSQFGQAFGQSTVSPEKLLGAIAPGQWAGDLTTPMLALWGQGMAGAGALGMPPPIQAPPMLQALRNLPLGGAPLPPRLAPAVLPAMAGPDLAGDEAIRQQQAAEAAGAPPPVNPPAGDPGHDPTQPVGRVLPSLQAFGQPVAFDPRGWAAQAKANATDPIEIEAIDEVLRRSGVAV